MRRPASLRNRSLALGGSASHRAESKRSSMAFDTLFTFWPPGPEARTERTSIS